MNTGISAEALKPLSWLGWFSCTAGLNGIDLAPTFDYLPGHTPSAMRRAHREGAFELGGLHSPIRGSSGGEDQGYKVSGLAAHAAKFILGTPGLGRLVMPRIADAAPIMDRYQQAVDKRVPICFFPLRDPADDLKMRQTANGSLSLFQLKDEAAALVGAKTAHEFNNTYLSRGYDGYICDTAHTPNEQPAGKGVVSDVDRTFSEYAPDVRGVHFSVNRQDLGGTAAVNSRQDGMNALDGKITGRTAEMLQEVRDHGQVEFVSLEGTFDAMADMIAEHRHAKGRAAAVTLDDIGRAYRDMADVVVGYLGGVRIYR